jgi:hypothetical protein
LAEESKVNKINAPVQQASESMGENGISLPAVPVAQLAKFHAKAKKQGEANDPHEDAAKTFKLTTQRKVAEPFTEPVQQQEAFKPSAVQLKEMDGFAIGPYRPEPVQKKSSRDLPVVQQMSATGVAQLEGEEDGWTEVKRKGRGKGAAAPRDPATPAPSSASASVETENPFAPLAASSPRTVTELATGMSSLRAEWASDDDVLMEILKGPFEANWFKARACLTMGQWPSTITPDKKPSHDDGVLLMNALVDMRWRVWKEFTDIALGKMQTAVKVTAQNPAMASVKDKLLDEGKEKDKDKLAKTLDPVGSMAVTSDIDLSLGGSNTEIAVGLLNKEFRSHFGVPYDPGTVFDINVYASDWIHGADDTSTPGSTTKEYTPKPEVKGMSKHAVEERDDKMEVWSLVKVRRNMEQAEWESYVRQTLSVLPEGAAKTKMKNKLDQAALEYAKFRDTVTKRIQKNDAKLKADESRLTFSGGKKSAFENNAEYEESAAETRASNEIYAEKLVEIKALRLQLNTLTNAPVKNQVEIDNLGKVLGDKIAEALTYANEVYATEGAVQHTVLDQGAGKKLDKLKAEAADERKKPVGQQRKEILDQENIEKVKYNLRKELFLQSVNENVGDALHSMHAYHHLPYYAAYRAGKYLSRLVEASSKLIDDEEALARIPFYEEVAHVGKTAMSIKSNKVVVEGKELEGDPAEVEKNGLFKTFDHGKVDALRVKVISFGAKVPAIFNEKKVEATGE